MIYLVQIIEISIVKLSILFFKVVESVFIFVTVVKLLNIITRIIFVCGISII